jgi:predicted helicase
MTERKLRWSRGIIPGFSRSANSTADRVPELKIHDPAVGTGVFLEAIIRLAHQRFRRFTLSDDKCDKWSALVAERLLPSIVAYDVQLGPLVCAYLRVACCLGQRGFDFRAPRALQIQQRDVLRSIPFANESADASTEASARCMIVGNPPYGSFQSDASDAMRKLMHGKVPGWGGDADYFSGADGPIAERKTWLYDQYVQFLRYAHWRVSQADQGVIAFLTNRGFLHHITMRGMRYQWLRSFRQIEIHDLQGGSDRSSGDYDSVAENVFGVRSGIAISILAHDRNNAKRPAAVELFAHAGTASFKLRRLEAGPGKTQKPVRIVPRPPAFVFGTTKRCSRLTTREHWRLDDCFVCKSSAVVTARDSLVVAQSRRELLERIELLRDPSVNDETIRKLYFPRGRSHRFARGDTRSWKLDAARELLAFDGNWNKHARRCCYRPFDDRWIYWHPRMIDWPRTKISTQLLGGNNPALIARRQATQNPDAVDFWITRWPTLDGLLRSDNRGNEYVFPLYSDDQPDQCNLSAGFLEHVESCVGQTIVRRRKNDNPSVIASSDSLELTTQDVFAFLMAQVFSTSYRRMSFESAQDNFCPVQVVSNADFFQQLAGYGRSLISLIAWHDIDADEADKTELVSVESPRSERRHAIVYESGRVRMGGMELTILIAPEVWNFCAGNHQVARKWLTSRRAQLRARSTQEMFSRVVSALAQIQTVILAIDAAVERHGGWHEACRQKRLPQFSSPRTG